MNGLKIAGILLMCLVTCGVIPCILIVASFEFFAAPWDWLATTAVVAIVMVYLRLLIRGDS